MPTLGTAWAMTVEGARPKQPIINDTVHFVPIRLPNHSLALSLRPRQ